MRKLNLTKQMKKLVSLFAFLFTLGFYAQELKIKKGIISLNGTEAAKVDNKKRLYTISTLSDEPRLTVEMKIFPLVDGTNIYYCELTDLKSSRKSECLDEGKAQSLSFEKNIVASLVDGKYKFLTEKGLDDAVIEAFFNEMPQGTLLKSLEEKNNQIANEEKLEMEKFTTQKINLTKNGGFYIGENQLGTILRVEERDFQGFSVFRYQIQNKDGHVVANWYYSSRTNPVTEKLDKEFILTKDQKSFFKLKYDTAITPSFSTDYSKDGNAKRIIAKLYSKGYLTM